MNDVRCDKGGSDERRGAEEENESCKIARKGKKIEMDRRGKKELI